MFRERPPEWYPYSGLYLSYPWQTIQACDILHKLRSTTIA